MVKSISLNFRLSLYLKYLNTAKGVCGIQKSTIDVKARGLCRFGVTDSLKGVKSKRNRGSRQKTQNLLNKSNESCKSFQVKLHQFVQIGEVDMYQPTLKQQSSDWMF